MADTSSTELDRKFAEMFDDELIALLSINAAAYNDEYLSRGRAEAERRGILSDVQVVSFDVFLNNQGFVGRLILLEEQLMFISTGMFAVGTPGSGLMGAALGERRLAERRIAAARLDFSSLDNEGSWIYFLDQILDCRAEWKLLSNSELQFVIKEEDGSIRKGVVNCGGLSKSDSQDLARKILEARDRLTNSQSETNS